jgi:hypothetical protein
MNEGRIEQIGSPDAVYEHPANSFVYRFLGSVNLFHTRIKDGQVQLGEAPIGAAAGEPEALAARLQACVEGPGPRAQAAPRAGAPRLAARSYGGPRACHRVGGGQAERAASRCVRRALRGHARPGS